MKSILILLLFTSIAFAQRDKTFNFVAKKPTEKITESGSVSFVKTMNSLQFDRSLSNDIKEKITRFMKKNRPNYRDLGGYTFNLVVRKNKLFVQEQTLPERLVLLD